ncbi:MAG: homoserine kinase [Limnochordia bacterium]|nr:homoserine kinase [Limnochordia bacterium]MDD2629081.1 homoserine kinase [Limnochordia bacterium]MDD4517582.1 homoserine kinase [Limnochordia bacterium]
MAVRVKVPATTANLGPGFDCLGLALGLYNVFTVEETPKGFSLEVFGESQGIAKGKGNLFVRTMDDVFRKVGYRPAGLRVVAENNIPLARGMGSSATAIVGGLVAGNALSGNTLGEAELVAMASAIEGHPDNVAPALLGGLVTVFTDSEKQAHYQRVVPKAGLRVCLAIPEFTLSTKKARAALPKEVAMSDAVFNLGRVAVLVAAMCQGNLEVLSQRELWDDCLHQPYRAFLIPGLKDVFAAAKNAGAYGAAISGAGPTVVAFTGDRDAEVQQAMGLAFEKHGINCRCVTTDISEHGALASTEFI